MKIYTKTGDKGDTSLFGGQRVPKDALRIEAYGTVDELNSVLGIVRAEGPARELDAVLGTIQDHLFVLGADLATPRSLEKKGSRRIGAKETEYIEHQIDRFDAELQPLNSFILPGARPALPVSTLHEPSAGAPNVLLSGSHVKKISAMIVWCI